MSSIYESNVDPLRPNDAHGISLQLVGRGKRVLELGAASGHVTKALVALGNTVTAVERDGRFADTLRSITPEVHITDLDWLDLRQITKGERFDVVLAGDVLEHCPRPDLVAMQCHSLLADGGSLVVSLPNIAHADVRLALLEGRFEYRQSGLLDQTHLRFFTRRTIERFAHDSGFEIAEIFASTAPIGGTEFGPPSSTIPVEAIRFVQNDRDSVVYQYVARLVPINGFSVPSLPLPKEQTTERLLAELGQSYEAHSALTAAWSAMSSTLHEVDAELSNDNTNLQYKLADAEHHLADTQHKLADAEHRLNELAGHNRQLELKLLAARDAVIGTSAELGEMRRHHEVARAQVDTLVHQINLLHSSRTWRIGRFMLLPLRGVRRILRMLMS